MQWEMQIQYYYTWQEISSQHIIFMDRKHYDNENFSQVPFFPPKLLVCYSITNRNGPAVADNLFRSNKLTSSL